MPRTNPRLTNSSSIAQRRIALGITQEQLAERIGCPQSSVSRWETTGKLPGTHYLLKIAEVLGCQITDLITTPKED